MNLVSNCCNAKTRINNPSPGRGQTVYWICDKCDKPCDQVEATTPWQTELLRLASLVGTDARQPENNLIDFIQDLVDRKAEIISRAFLKAQEHGTLPDPNPHGKTLTVKRHNQVIKEMSIVFIRELRRKSEAISILKETE